MKLFTCLIFFVSFVALSTEVDSFSRRYQPLEDSLPQLNKMVRAAINYAVERSNYDYSCNEKSLYHYLKRKFNLFGWSKFEIKISISRDFPKLSTPDVSIFEYFPFCGIKLPFTVAPLVRVGDVLVGVDKFSHFFNEGWSYFKISDLKRRGVQEALKSGIDDERGFWGVMTTGVYSYADLIANYQGMLFWHDLVRGDRPFIECQSKRWVVVRKFDWNDYIDKAFDEGYNCSSFRNEKMGKAFVRRIEELEQETGQNMNCPISLEVCQQLTLKYGELSSVLLHPLCDQNSENTGSDYVYRRVY